MIFDDYFIVIPVYRLPEDKYYSEMNKDFEKLVSSTWDEDFRKNNPDLVENWKRSHRSSYGGDWEFNEIIGHIKLFFMGSQVRGEYWSTKPRRKVKTRKKEFEFKAHKLAAESEIWDKTNSGILSAIEEYLSRCERELKNRHIDLREFEALKAHIDWVSVHKVKNKFA
ncbi:hypothetical protein IC617_02655 [Neiella sp. HB171785]|uniref:Uncharacterized protein n=1 Tax=Neiella litorisoli TaxID=2771431 RepID=A0A8J6QH14_9GAMM|nr:hypothetical protein [Neiella litorisoli]MBD1388317.1 hypothetical protein [Neiella litorisoli]